MEMAAKIAAEETVAALSPKPKLAAAEKEEGAEKDPRRTPRATIPKGQSAEEKE